MVEKQEKYESSFEPELMFRCGECGSVYCEEEDAYECCVPSVSEVWRCRVCGEVHRRKGKAFECCEDKRNAAAVRPTTAELEAAGQLRLGV